MSMHMYSISQPYRRSPIPAHLHPLSIKTFTRLGGRHGQTRKCAALHHLRKSPLTVGNLHLIWTN